MTTTDPDTPAAPRSERSLSLWPAAALMTVVIVVLIVVFVALYPDDGSDNPPDRAATATSRPKIITRPEDGVPPEEPGDPGGWEQLALLAVIVAGLGTVGTLVWRSSKKARAPSP